MGALLEGLDIAAPDRLEVEYSDLEAVIVEGS